MKRLLPILLLVLFLGCTSLPNRANWKTVSIQKQGWPTESWTYKRTEDQAWVWALFGNEEDGVTPYFRGEQWPYWKWWLRNRFHNWKWHVIGYANWEEGNPYASWDTSHLEYKIIVGEDPPNDSALGWQLRLVKPKFRSYLAWRPFLCFNGKWFRAWWGWKRRGQKAASIEFGRND